MSVGIASLAPSTKEERIRIVYLLAASHSGSTLLAMLLGAHPEICTVGELKFTAMGDVNKYLCSCQKRILECEFWNGIKDEMKKRGHEFDISNAGTDFKSVPSSFARRLLKPLHRGPLLEGLRDIALNLSSSWRSSLAMIQKRNRALISSVLAATGAKVIVDSSKIGLRLKYLLRNSSLDVKVVRLIRDGRGVALTYVDPANYADARDPSKRDGGCGGDRASERLSMRLAAREWRRSNEEAEAILKSLDPSRWITVRYEDICGATDESLKIIHEFLGVERLDQKQTFRSAPQHVVGNGMRLNLTSEIRHDDRWKVALGPEELGIFNEEAGEINALLGYGVHPA